MVQNVLGNLELDKNGDANEDTGNNEEGDDR